MISWMGYVFVVHDRSQCDYVVAKYPHFVFHLFLFEFDDPRASEPRFGEVVFDNHVAAVALFKHSHRDDAHKM